MLTKQIKNIDTVEHTWNSISLNPQDTYVIPDEDYAKWAYCSEVEQDIYGGKLEISTGYNIINRPKDAIDYLKLVSQAFTIDIVTKRQKVYSSPKPDNHNTVFQGAGDTAEAIGAGNVLMMKIAAGDASKYVEIEFNNDVHIKDGVVQCINAPFGAYFDFDLIHPSAGKVGYFCSKVPIIGSNIYTFNSEDRADLPEGIKLRITAYNADGTGDFDAAAEFILMGFVELYRDADDV